MKKFIFLVVILSLSFPATLSQDDVWFSEAENGNLEIINPFIDEGGDVNTVDNNGRTALYSVTDRGTPNLTNKILL